MLSKAQETHGKEKVQGFVGLLDQFVEGGERLLVEAIGSGNVMGVHGGVRAATVMVEVFGVFVLLELDLEWLLELGLLFLMVVLDGDVFPHLVAV